MLSGQLLRAPEVRVTPAGIPISRFVLAHRSTRKEAGSMRDVQCHMTVVASGRELGRRIAALAPGSWIRVEGFLSRAGYRAPDTRIELHVLSIRTIENDG